ncbi:MAG: DUF2239 family protein [Myxococcales bacterium]|nr:DUF2239 family protein [Myxococcales bacterium]
MSNDKSLYVAFHGEKLLGRGPLAEVATLCFESNWEDLRTRIAVYEDESGRVRDLNLSGTEEEVLARLSEPTDDKIPEATKTPSVSNGLRAGQAKRGPGRPKLGVVSREISLLPRHWSWLSEQQGGASASLRRLVEMAKKNESTESRQRRVVDAAHRFLWDIAGDQPNFEELSRALYAANITLVETLSSTWPEGIRDQLARYLRRHREAASAAS